MVLPTVLICVIRHENKAEVKNIKYACSRPLDHLSMLNSGQRPQVLHCNCALYIEKTNFLLTQVQ